MNYIPILLPEMLSIILPLVLLLLGIVLNRNIINFLALVCALVTLTSVILLAEDKEIFFFNQFLKLNLYIRSAQGLVLVVGVLILLMLTLSKYNYKYEFSVLILFSLFGMITLISANNLISLYLAFELMSIPSYVLTSFNKNSVYSSEAGIKYFVLSALSSSIMLYGMSLLYGYSGGEIDFSRLNVFIHSHTITYGIVFGLFLILVGLAFKLAVAPFHMWAIDVYHGAPTIASAFLSTAPKVALIAFLIRMMNEVTNMRSYVNSLFLYLAGLSVLISAFGGLRQKNLKRLFAYSSIGHVGVMIASLSIFTKMGTDASLIYLIVYIITNIGLFSCFIQIDDDNCNIANLSGISEKQPFLAFNLSVLLFSMAGIPPLAGFFTKFLVLNALISSGFIILSLILVVAGVVSCFYYLNLIKMMYFDKPSKNIISLPRGLLIITSLTSLSSVIFFVFLDDLKSLIHLITNGL